MIPDETDLSIYILKNDHLKKFYSRNQKNAKGFEWTEFARSAIFRGEGARDKCHRVRKELLREQSYQQLTVKKYMLTEIIDN